jgi:hypothetical protein
MDTQNQILQLAKLDTNRKLWTLNPWLARDCSIGYQTEHPVVTIKLLKNTSEADVCSSTPLKLMPQVYLYHIIHILPLPQFNGQKLGFGIYVRFHENRLFKQISSKTA